MPLWEENIMDEPKIVFDPYAGPQQREVVEQILALLKVRLTGHEDWYPVAFFLKTDAGEILGGLLGMIWARWLHIGSLAVHELFRGRGWGSRLLERAEQYALERGCTKCVAQYPQFPGSPALRTTRLRALRRIRGLSGRSFAVLPHEAPHSAAYGLERYCC